MRFCELESRLIALVVKTLFSPTIASVAQCIHRHYPCTMFSIHYFTALPLKVIKECLIILIHHDLVTVSLSESIVSSATHYEFVYERVLDLLCLPIIMREILDQHQHLKDILLDVVVKGRVRYNSDFYNDLLALNLLEFHQQPEHLHPSSSGLSPLIKRHRVDKWVKLPVGVATKKAAIIALSERELFTSLNSEHRSLFHLILAKHLAIKRPADIISSIPTFVKTQLEFGAFQVSQEAADLAASLSKSVPETLKELHFKYPGLLKSPRLDQYYLDIDILIDTTLSLHAHDHIKARYGLPYACLFACLLDKKYIDERSLSRCCLQPLKETRALLYKMFADEIVHLQEIPKTTDHAPSKTIYAWTAERAGLKWLGQHHLKTIVNLMERAEYEGISKMSSNMTKFVTKRKRQAMDTNVNNHFIDKVQRVQAIFLGNVERFLVPYLVCLMQSSNIDSYKDEGE